MSLNVKGTRAEFFRAGRALACCALSEVGAVPEVGEFVSIRGITYRVLRRTWAVDHADELMQAELRANIDIEEAPDA